MFLRENCCVDNFVTNLVSYEFESVATGLSHLFFLLTDLQSLATVNNQTPILQKNVSLVFTSSYLLK